MKALRFALLLVLGVAAYAMSATAAARRVAPADTAAADTSGGAARPIVETQIAAVVNDEVISVYDLMSRIKMLLVSSNLPDTPEMRKRLAPQVLRKLVDEKLQMQEAKKQGVTATPAEVKKALSEIAQQNHMQPNQLDAFLKSHGIDKQALVNQLTASIVWAKLVRRLAAQTSEPSDAAIDETLKRLKEHAGEPESRVAEIFLAIDKPSQDAEVRQLAERLSDQMHHGARFSAIAEQYSQSATAAVGGDLGWVRPDQLGPVLGKAVAQLRPGELSAPIRTNAGYYLLLVIDRRTGNSASEQDTVLRIVQVVFPLPAQAGNAMKRAAIAEAESIRSAATSCPALLKIGKEKAPQLSSEGNVRLSQISPTMRSLVMRLPQNQPSEPILQKNGVGIIMVCDKSVPKTVEPTREDVVNMLLRQRLDALARRYMRDLRLNAFVDVRIAGLAG